MRAGTRRHARPGGCTIPPSPSTVPSVPEPPAEYTGRGQSISQVPLSSIHHSIQPPYPPGIDDRWTDERGKRRRRRLGRKGRGCERDNRSIFSFTLLPSTPTNQARTASPVQNTTHTHITYVSLDYDTGPSMYRSTQYARSVKGGGGPKLAGVCIPLSEPPHRPQTRHLLFSSGAQPQSIHLPIRRQHASGDGDAAPPSGQTKKDPRPGPARATDGASPTGGGFRTLLSFFLLSRPFTGDDRVDRHGLLFLLSSPPPPLHTLVWGFSILGAQAFNLSCVHMPRQASSYHAWVLGRIPLAGLVRRRGVMVQ